LIPLLVYVIATGSSQYRYSGVRDRIILFSLVAGSGLVMADMDGPWMLRRAAGIALAVANVVNFGEFFVGNPYNGNGGARSAGFYGDPNICVARRGVVPDQRIPRAGRHARCARTIDAGRADVARAVGPDGMSPLRRSADRITRPIGRPGRSARR
jgi:hypothetical protein